MNSKGEGGQKAEFGGKLAPNSMIPYLSDQYGESQQRKTRGESGSGSSRASHVKLCIHT